MKHKVLLYDDDADILDVCSTILTMRGFDVLCKNDCRTIDDDINGYQPQVILMDNWLPDMGGVKAVQQIKATPAFANIPVVFFSANSHVEELARESGADYMLKKPFDIDQLETTIKEALQDGVKPSS